MKAKRNGTVSALKLHGSPVAEAQAHGARKVCARILSWDICMAEQQQEAALQVPMTADAWLTNDTHNTAIKISPFDFNDILIINNLMFSQFYDPLFIPHRSSFQVAFDSLSENDNKS